MPTSLRLAVAEFRERPGRSVLPGVALVVGVACLSAALMLSDAMVSATARGASTVPAGVSTVVRPTSDGEVALDAAVLDRVVAVPGVRDVVPVRQVRADLLLDGGRAGAGRAVAEIESTREDLRRVPIGEGRAPGADGEIAVDRVTAYRHGLAPGASVRVADAEGRPIDVVVRGVTVRGGFGNEPLIVVGEELAAKLGGRPEITALYVFGGDRAAVSAAAGAGMRAQAAAVVSAERPGNELMIVLLPFSILALATSVFVASATYRAVYLQRQRHTALLRCLGAHRGPLVWANLIEAVLTGAVAGALGGVAGGSVGWLLARLFDAAGLSEVLGAVRLDPPLLPTAGQFALGVGVAAVLSGFAAVRPSFAAVRVAPLAALRTSEGQTPDRAVVRRRYVFGVVVVGFAAALAALGLMAGGIGAVFLVLFSCIAAVGGLFGVLGPVVVPALGRVFGVLAGRIGGAQWRLAAAEVRRVPQRSASVAMPLLLAAAMVTFFAVTVGAVRTVEDKFEDEPRPDAVVVDAGHRVVDAGTVAAVDRPEVRSSLVVHTAEGSRQVRGEPAPYQVLGADPERLRAWLADRGTAVPGFGAGSVLLSEWLVEEFGARVGQPVTLDGVPGGPVTGTFTGTIPFELLDGANAVVGATGFAPASKVLVTLRDGADPAAFRAGVLDALGSAPTVLVRTRADVTAENQRMIDIGITTMMVLLGLSVAVAVTGIGTALTISVQERRKELALRRALGVTRGGIKLGVVAEAVLLSLVGVVGGGVFGFAYAELTLMSLGVFAVPSVALVPLLVGGVGVVVLAVLSAFGPASGASRIRPAAGLASG
ncbi:ABC transporter permease [Saccharothrix violaceirubra]|uniref:Putative ABC transport system permease protein n=1 Tax=Saccharothrix violaceirubra TaxID=413306 RepID=A0A7W7WVY4_9PSEU|nr:FtsX-like permease family protein [Saccharothrix violaceirubra]MBB4964983.1 putative ABC transport system permease protein [Saccharothrix violaceirubra]